MQWESWKEICFLWGETTYSYIWRKRERSFLLEDFRILKKEGELCLTLMKIRHVFPPSPGRFSQGQVKERGGRGRGELGLVQASAFRTAWKTLGPWAYVWKGTICLALTCTGMSWAFFLCYPWVFSFLQLGNHPRFGKLISCLWNEKKKKEYECLCWGVRTTPRI